MFDRQLVLIGVFGRAEFLFVFEEILLGTSRTLDVSDVNDLWSIAVYWHLCFR